MSSVQARLAPEFVLDRAVGNLDHQQDVRGRGMGRSVGALALRVRPQNGQIRLGLGSVAEPNRVLDADLSRVLEALDEEARELIDLVGMEGTNRGHLDDLPLDQLDPIVLAQDAGFGHSVVLVDGEQPLRRQRHGTTPRR